MNPPLRRGDDLEIARKIWFERTDLSVARVQIYARGGRVTSDVHYADWLAPPAPPEASGPSGPVRFPRQIQLYRPREDYQLELRITKLALNEAIGADRFRLEQPPGTELVRVGDAPAGRGERP